MYSDESVCREVDAMMDKRTKLITELKNQYPIEILITKTFPPAHSILSGRLWLL